jgi:uncharacterized protein (TIGR02246 family)
MASTVDEPVLTDDANEVTARYVAAMNAGDVAAVLDLYTADAVSIWEPGNPIHGAAHRAAVTEFLAGRPKMQATVRESYITGDAALLVVDWTIDVTDEHGQSERLTGTGLDVLRRGPDGKWRYAIDNPYGDVA